MDVVNTPEAKSTRKNGQSKNFMGDIFVATSIPKDRPPIKSLVAKTKSCSVKTTITTARTENRLVPKL